MVQYSELYLGAMVEYNEQSALLNSCLERLSSIETKGTERMNSIETQLKKQGKRINELQSVVETLENTENGGTQMSDQHQFFLFLTSIRPELRAESKSASEQAKVAGEKWKAMSFEEKARFNDEADGKRKAYRER